MIREEESESKRVDGIEDDEVMHDLDNGATWCYDFAIIIV